MGEIKSGRSGSARSARPRPSRAVLLVLGSDGVSPVPAKLQMGRAQRVGKVRKKAVEGPVDRVRLRDQNIVGSPAAAKGKNRRGGSPKPALGPVALDRAADFAAGGEADPQ